jgi:hypothetical protein
MQTTSETIIDKLNAHIASECSEADTDRMYNDMLDECYSFENVGGIFSHMQPSRVLAECDPVAYRCGKNDYIDGCDITEVCGVEYHDADIDKAKEEFIDALRDELSELETELSECLESDDECELADEVRIKRAINDKQSEIDECEKHSF